MFHGFVKVASAIPTVKVASPTFNTKEIGKLIIRAQENHAEIVCFPELSITAYSCQDLFNQQTLIESAELSLMKLVNETRSLDIISIVGIPVSVDSVLYNCAAVLQKGKIAGIVPKSFLPNYNEFYELRWFTSGAGISTRNISFAGQTVPFGTRQIFHAGSFTFGIEICEDLWAPIPPSSQLTLRGAEIIFNLSASNDSIGKHEYLKTLVSQQSARTLCGYIYSGCGFGESTQDIVFSGIGMIYEEGHLLTEAERFNFSEQLIVSEIDVERLRNERRTNTTFTTTVEQVLKESDPYNIVDVRTVSDYHETHLTRPVDPHPFVPKGKTLDDRCEEILNIQVQGLAKRLMHIGAKTVTVGISGGLDSTLALLVCIRAFDSLGLDRKGIIGITMPGFGTTRRTYTNATYLMKSLGISIREISIAEACMQHFHDLDIDPNTHDVTYENSQARERTQILMDAANQLNGLVIGTSDLSELALGWTTYNGDHISMYGVNASVPKTLVRHIVIWIAQHIDSDNCRKTLLDIADTPISPELLPVQANGTITQKTEDLVGPYELHDFFLYYVLRFGFSPAKIFFLARQAFSQEQYADDIIKKWLYTFYSRFFTQQFKRSCSPDGPKVGSCSLSPRGDWRMPSDADSYEWLSQCDELKNL